MKTKLLVAILATGALFATGPVQATSFYSGTLASWIALGAAGITDGDADTKWVAGTTNFSGAQAALITVNFDETEGALGDSYTLTFTFSGLPGGFLLNQTDFFNYAAAIVSPSTEWFQRVKLDTDGGLNNYGATKQVTPNIGSVINLSSSNGVPDGFTSFTNQPNNPTSLGVHEVFTADANGQLTSSTNVYFVANRVIQTPEPAPLLLLGVGLAGLAFTRRRKSS